MTNKIKVQIEMTAHQRKDFLKALADIKRQGAQDDGRAAQLLAINYLADFYEPKVSKSKTEKTS
jgi:hypothetical protein